MNILIITKSTDHPGVMLTMDALRRRGARPYRFDSDRFPTELDLRLCHGAGASGLLDTCDGPLDLDDVDAVYYRRVSHGTRLPPDLEPPLREACAGEIRSVVEGLVASLPGFHLDPLPAVRRAQHKPLQLRLAERVGLQVPRTLISNDPDAVRDFAATCPDGVVCKMMSTFAVVRDGREEVMFTSAVHDHDLADLDGLRLAPMTFQERVPKHLELRVTVVGDRVFSSAVDSGASARATTDWRRDGHGLLPAWAPVDVPDEIETRLLRLMDALGLQYGAADFILTPDGRYVFLEVNPVGEYFWLDDQREKRISDALADVLLGIGRRQPAPAAVAPSGSAASAWAGQLRGSSRRSTRPSPGTRR